MRKIEINWDGVKRSEAAEAYAEKKLEKAAGFLTGNERIDCVVRKAGDAIAFEAVAKLRGGKIARSEVKRDDLNAAIDECGDKIARSLRKIKEKALDAKRRNGTVRKPDEAVPEEAFDWASVARVKTVAVQPATIDEAIEEMEALDHDFHLFLDAKSGGKPCVAYRRKDGGYGVIAMSDVK